MVSSWLTGPRWVSDLFGHRVLELFALLHRQLDEIQTQVEGVRAMKLIPVVLVLAWSLLVARQVVAEPWSKQLTPQKPDENFTIEANRVKGTDILQFRVTVKLKDNKDLPVNKSTLRIFDGQEYIALCPVQSSGPEGERVFVFRVAAKYAEKSKFAYTQASDFDFNSYWFYLKDFAESK
jgi:hypothetical protein